MKVNERIKEVRKDRKNNQKELAQVIETTQQQYQLYESGKRELKASQIITLAKYFNVSTDYLLGLTDEETPLSPMREKE